ncbi:MAG: hypothetical protein WDA03_08035 [Trueperaceae bacterium]
MKHDERGVAASGYGEAVRASPELVDVAIPLLLTLFPGREVRGDTAGRLVALRVNPPLQKPEVRRLLGFLFELVDRPEWRARCAVAREVSDVHGTRTEVVLPVRPPEYAGGEALVGPFPTQEAAADWAAGVADASLAFDTVEAHCGHLVDLFVLGELLAD